MAQNLTVTKGNILIQASYSLTLEEQRLILACIAQLDARTSVPDDITITAIDYSDAFNLPKKTAYQQLATAAKRLYERDVKIDNLTEEQHTHLRWVQDIIYRPGVGKVVLSFGNKIKPYLGQLKNRFTSYSLQQIANLNSPYAIRIYELLQQYKSTGTRIVTVEDLRDYLDLQNKYAQFKYLKQWIINPSLSELNTKTNLVIDYTPIKNGRKIYALKFKFCQKKPKQILTEKPSLEDYVFRNPGKTRGKSREEVIKMMRSNS